MASWRSPVCLWLRRNLVPMAVIIVSIAVLAFWHYRQTEHTVARRVFSVANANDFSWRNRLDAWEGSLQMMAERPWFGYGWDRTEKTYEQFYCPPEVPDPRAIETNDYLMLGTTLGIPALLGFFALVMMSLKPRVGSRHTKSQIQGDGLKLAGRAGVFVMLVGFWFDGGLFRLATATPFWILLELGRDGSRTGDEQPEDQV